MKVERQLEKEEAELARLNLAMQQAAQQQNGVRINEISQALHSCQHKIDGLFDELEAFTRNLETCNNEFENRLKNLDSEIK